MPTETAPACPLVGRERELAELASLVGVGREAPTSAVLVAGDAGVGKTRLLSELGQRARDAGWRVLLGHCLDFGESALPYLPFTEMVGRLTAESSALVDALAEAHPALRYLQPGRRQLTGISAVDAEGTERADLFEAVHAALERLGSASPLLVVVEDVHWADRSTRDLLTFLFTRGFTTPVSLVASYRSDDLHRRHPLRAVAAQWARLPGVHRCQLSPLSDAAVRELVQALHPGPLPESSLHAIVERAEGNAFFTEELVVAAEVEGRRIPDDLADLLLVRLDQLGDAAREVVRAASCAGRQVSHELLAKVVDLEGTTLEDALREAVEGNVLVAGDGSRYAFRHALLAEAVYADLLPGERVRLHAAYVDALCSRKVVGTAAELALHAHAAHDRVTAVRANVEAGDEAMAVGGPAEAASHYEQALDLLGDVESRADELADVDLVTLTAKASDAALTAGHPHRALSLVRDQLAHLPATTPATDRARLLMTLGMAALLSDTTVDALEATGEALRLLPEEPSPLRAKVMSVHARANSDRQRYEEAVRWAVQALEMGEQLGLSRVVADATTTLARLEDRTGNPDDSRRALEKIVAQARDDGDAAAELRGLHHLGGLHYEGGNLEEAAHVYSFASERAGETGLRWAPYGFDVRVMAGITAYVMGDWEAADRITDVTRQDPPALAEAALASVALSVAAGRGDESALGLLPAIRPWWDRDGFVAILSGGAAIDLHGDRGDIESAIRAHDDVVDSVERLWQERSFVARIRLSAMLLGQVATAVSAGSSADRAALLDRAEDLRAAADEALQRAERRRGRSLGPEGRAWTARVEAEHLRVRWLGGTDVPTEEGLVDAWRRAVGGFEGFGQPFELARSRARLAAVLRSAGRAEEAREQADLARVTAHRLGAEPLLAELRSLGVAALVGRGTSRPGGGSARRRRAAPGEASTQGADAVRGVEVLTPREREILALVAEGRSNGEIGRRLFISPKTVSVHVSNILAKLGAAGRTEAVAVARRRGLLP